MLFVCLCVYVMACRCCLFIDFIGEFCVLLWYCIGCLCFGCACVVCGVLCCCVLSHWFVVRVCVVAVVLLSVLFFCYGLNAFPVCCCMLYVPSVRCSFLFV